MYDEKLKKIIKELEGILQKDKRWYDNSDSSLRSKLNRIGKDRVIKIPTYLPIHVEYPTDEDYTKPKFDFQKEEKINDEYKPKIVNTEVKEIKVLENKMVMPKPIKDEAKILEIKDEVINLKKPDIPKIVEMKESLQKPDIPKIVEMKESLQKPDIIKLNPPESQEFVSKSSFVPENERT